MLLQNLQTAALLIIVCECGWHKIALCQNALPLQIKVVFYLYFFKFGRFLAQWHMGYMFLWSRLFQKYYAYWCHSGDVGFLAIKRLPTVRTEVMPFW